MISVIFVVGMWSHRKTPPMQYKVMLVTAPFKNSEFTCVRRMKLVGCRNCAPLSIAQCRIIIPHLIFGSFRVLVTFFKISSLKKWYVYVLKMHSGYLIVLCFSNPTVCFSLFYILAGNGNIPQATT